MNIGGFEIIYKKNQVSVLGSPFISYDVSENNRPEYREIGAFYTFCESRIWSSYESCGLFSPKFFDKANINTSIYQDFIKKHNDADVWLFHPFPREVTIANHFLELAELEHPGISSALSRVWHLIFNRPLPEIDLVQYRLYACHCNYFSANPIFWNDYSQYVSRFNKLLLSEEGSFLRVQSPYTLTLTSDRHLPLAVFVFERSLTHFLFDNRRKFKIANLGFDYPIWSPSEIFPGEADIVSELLSAISSAPERCRREARQLAVSSYYFRRKLERIKK